MKQTEATSLSVTNVLDETQEELQFKDRVTEMALSEHHLVVVTATQCVIFSTTNWSTPHILELRGTVSLILQAPTHPKPNLTLTLTLTSSCRRRRTRTLTLTLT